MPAADLLTGLRLLAAPVLPMVAGRPRAFVVVAATCAASDAVDGLLARRSGTASRRGAVLDSVADAAFFAGLVAACLRARPDASRALAPAVAGVTAVRGAAALVGAVRWGRPVLLHTWSDKAAGSAVVVGVVTLVARGSRGPLAGALVVAAGAAAEELRQVATAVRRPDVDDPGVLGSVASRLVGRR